MRKIYLLLTALLVTLSVHAADWYLCGSNFGWSDNSTYKLTPVENTTDQFSISVSSLSGDIKIKEGGSWDTSFGSNGSKLQEGVEYKASKNGGDISVDGKIEDATIVINTINYTILVTGAAKENEYDTVYLVGQINSNGWSENITNYPLKLKEGTQNVWEGKYTLTASTNYFKMKAGAYIYGTGTGDVNANLGETYTASMSGSAFILASGEYTFTFVLDKNAETGKLTVTSDSPVTYPDKMYVVGHLNGGKFEPTNTSVLASIREGVYSGDVKVTNGENGASDGYFSFLTTPNSDWNKVGQRYGATSSDFPVTIGTAMTVQAGENAFKTTPGTYTMTLDLVSKTLLVEEKNILPDNLYIFGNVNGKGFAPNNGVKMNNEGDGIFTAENVVFGNAGGGKGYFYFGDALGADETDASWTMTRWGSGTDDVALESGEEATLHIGTDKAFNVIEGTYDVTVNLEDATVQVELVEAALSAPQAKIESTEGAPSQVKMVLIVENTPDDGTANYVMLPGATEATGIPVEGLNLAEQEGVRGGGKYTLNVYAQRGTLKSPETKVSFVMYPKIATLGDGKFKLNVINAEGVTTYIERSESNIAAQSAEVYEGGVISLAKGETVKYWTEADGLKSAVGVATLGEDGDIVSVEGIEVDGAEAVYYTLDGVKVAEPAEGIYIRVANGKAQKVVIRK
ncbi:MAG: hypothetical protein NC201_06225 [Prevotella sp.]|nr:hypothetical protein [Bacteroides sp.]MCM1366827.1 hypothetical protein [Prevotella sp.]MCM1437408.1 hypothetical protein [Prevotella sp.]